jgi:hypothetical protein
MMRVSPVHEPLDQTGFPSRLSDAAARRMWNQLERTFRGTYGAQAGLASIVRSLAVQMLRAGVTIEDSARTFELCVLHHPSCMSIDEKNLVTGESRVQQLLDLTRECVAAAAAEHARELQLRK